MATNRNPWGTSGGGVRLIRAPPVGVKVKVDLVDHDHSRRLADDSFNQVRIQRRHPIGDVRGHAHDISVAIAEKMEWQSLRMTANRHIDGQFIPPSPKMP